MKKALLIAPLCVILAANLSLAAPIPRLQGPVNDYANVVSADQQNRLRQFLLDQEQKTSNQIVVLTVNSTDGEDIESFAHKVFQNWRLGQADKNNGVLVVAAIKDRKMRIEVGKGLEGVLTDALSSQIIRNEIAPKFKTGDYGGGFWAGVQAIDKAIRGEYKADSRFASNVATVLIMMAVGIVILVLYVRIFRHGQRRPGVPWWYTGPSTWGGYQQSWGGFSSSSSWDSSGGFSGGGGGGSSGGGGASGGW